MINNSNYDIEPNYLGFTVAATPARIKKYYYYYLH